MDRATYDKHVREIEHYSAFNSAFVNKANGEDYITFRQGDKTLFTRENSLDVIADGTPPGPPKAGDTYDIVLNYLAFDEERNKYSVTFTDTYTVSLDEFGDIRSDYARSTPLVVDLGEKVITAEQILEYDRLRDTEALVSEYENVKGMLADFHQQKAGEAFENAERGRIESAERDMRAHDSPPRLLDVIRTRGKALRTYREECALAAERYEESKLIADKRLIDVRFGEHAPAVGAAIDADLRKRYPDLVERYESLPASAKAPRHKTMLDEYRHIRSELNGEAMKELAAECSRQLEAASALKIQLIRHEAAKPGIVESLRDPAKKDKWQAENDSLTIQQDYANNMMHVLWGYSRSGTDSEYVREIVDARLEAGHPLLFNYFVNKDSVEHRVGDSVTRQKYVHEGLEFYEKQHLALRNDIGEQLQKLHDHESRQPSLAKTIATFGVASRNWKKEGVAMKRQLDAMHNQEHELKGVLAFGEYSPEALQYAAEAMQRDPRGDDLFAQEQRIMAHSYHRLEQARSDSEKTDNPRFEYLVLMDWVMDEVTYSLAKEHSQAVSEYKALLEDSYRLHDNQPGFLRRLLTNDGAIWSESVRDNAERMTACLNKIDAIRADARDGEDSPAIQNRVDEVINTYYRPAVERREAALDVIWQQENEARRKEEAERATAREESPPEPEHGQEAGPQSPNRADGGRSA